MICCEASNGKEALSILETNTVDLVITDIRMPIIDGIELLGKISEKKLCPCVVLLSDYCEFNYARQGLIHGAFDYLSKPVDEEELFRLLIRVRRFLNDKKHELEKITELEKMAVQKSGTFYPVGDVKQIIEFIDKGSNHAIEVAAAMADTTGTVLENDVIKTAVVLKNVVSEIITSVNVYYPWLESFVDITELSNPDLTKCNDSSSVKAAITNTIEQILTTINRFEYDKQEKGVVYRICRYAIDNVDKDVSAKTISEALFINKTYVSEVFKDKTGITLGEYLTMLKMERAKRLLLEGTFKNYEIADKLGFKDIEYFGKLFKRYTKETPSEFRKIHSRKT